MTLDTAPIVLPTPAFRPMRVSELLDATIRLYRKNFLLLVAIVAIVQVPATIATGLLSVPTMRAAEEMSDGLLSPGAYDPSDTPSLFPPGMAEYWGWLALQTAVAGALSVLVGSLTTAALAWAVSERHLGHPVTVGRAYRAVLRRWQAVIGAALLLLLLNAALVILFLVPCLGALVAIPTYLFTAACLRFAPQVVMLEGCRARDALRRSWYLAKPHFWRVLGILALLTLFNAAITAGPSFLFTFGARSLETGYVLQMLLSTVVSAAMALLYVPIQRGAETFLYYDLRVRHEGLDLEAELDELAQALPAGTGAGDEAPRTPAWRAPVATEPFLTGRDWRNLAIVLGVVLGLLLVACALATVPMVVLQWFMRERFGDLQQLMTATPAF